MTREEWIKEAKTRYSQLAVNLREALKQARIASFTGSKSDCAYANLLASYVYASSEEARYAARQAYPVEG